MRAVTQHIRAVTQHIAAVRLQKKQALRLQSCQKSIATFFHQEDGGEEGEARAGEDNMVHRCVRTAPPHDTRRRRQCSSCYMCARVSALNTQQLYVQPLNYIKVLGNKTQDNRNTRETHPQHSISHSLAKPSVCHALHK